MNLVFKAAVGIYIVSVLVFSSFSKADTNFAISTDLYDLAASPTSFLETISNDRSLDNTPSVVIVSNLEGTLTFSEGEVFFVSSEDSNTYFKVSDSIIDQFEIDELPISVTVSGFYNSDRPFSKYGKLKTLNIGNIQFN